MKPTGSIPHTNPLRILAVDDEATSRMMLVATLQDAGYDVTDVEDPREALGLAQSGSFPVVVSDWNMPGMTGLELCRAIRASTTERYVYVILLTSNSDPSDVVEGLDSGADDFVVKPFNPLELIKRVEIGVRISSLDTRDATIFALAKLTESRDPETGSHLERVQNYSRELAAKLFEDGHLPSGLDEAFVKLIYSTTPLHDIGKVAIPDSVLLKPGQLNDQEFEIMKSHTVIGATTIAAVADRYPWAAFLRTAHDIARSHHERWDGSGYPDGLEGREIPVAARIMSVADVYDALTSKRVYKQAREHEVSVSIISEGSGTQFDPVIVDAFLSLEERFREIRETFSDSTRIAA